MLLLITLEPYAKMESIKEILRNFNYKYDVIFELSRKGKYLLKIESDDLDNVISCLRSINEISHIVIIEDILDTLSVDDLINRCRALLSKLTSTYGSGTFKVVVKRMFKKYPLTSIELARIIGQELSKYANPELERPKFIIYLEIHESRCLIGYSLQDIYFKIRKTIPKNWIDRIIGIVEYPRTVYEVMDLIQLSHALNVELRIIVKRDHIIRKAFEKLNLDESKVKVRTYQDLESALKGIDYLVALTQYAIFNEEKLIEITEEVYTSGKVLGFILGNEIDDVSLKARRMSNIEIRLGPQTGHPMRTSIALTYAIAIVVGTLVRRAKM